MKKRPSLSKILATATNVRPPYRIGQKVLIAAVAARLGMRPKALGPILLEHQARGEIALVRIDLVAAFESVPRNLEQSWVSMPGFPEKDGVHGWDAIDLGAVR